MPITTCIFDAYGTLFDVGGAAALAAKEPGQDALAQVWPALARDWRQKQLEYTWLRAVADQHCDFWQVTGDGLDWAMAAQGLNDPDLRGRLMDLYRTLPAYVEVPAMLQTLKKRGLQTGILSNGSPNMLADAVGSAGIAAHLDAVLSVETVGVFKPHKAVYDMVGRAFGCSTDQVLFVSSNGWDAAGASDYGFRTVWVNRTGAPMDKLYAAPHHILTDLTKIPDLI
ncbi:MAG: haloacid dehalogenase type II [Pseudomonadota bacterium]